MKKKKINYSLSHFSPTIKNLSREVKVEVAQMIRALSAQDALTPIMLLSVYCTIERLADKDLLR